METKQGVIMNGSGAGGHDDTSIGQITFEGYVAANRRCYDATSKTNDTVSMRDCKLETYTRYANLVDRINRTTFPNHFFDSKFLSKKSLRIFRHMSNYLLVTLPEWDRRKEAKKLDDLFNVTLFMDLLDDAGARR